MVPFIPFRRRTRNGERSGILSLTVFAGLEYSTRRTPAGTAERSPLRGALFPVMHVMKPETLENWYLLHKTGEARYYYGLENSLKE
ncbi:hypothetical protein SDC9_67735 [bioreactor metagenome]|jgi:hypothetical protein|uniref:Uncharacterized protein n=1 Tax=bioreactor metagenome TaxID=1076179 RepID=A0A644Y063_9ZZZZ